MPSSNDKLQLRDERVAFEARLIDNVASAVNGVMGATRNAVCHIAFFAATQRQVSAFAAGTGAGMKRDDIRDTLLAAFVFGGLGIKKGEDAPHFVDVGDALAYAKAIDANDVRNRIKGLISAGFQTATRILKNAKEQFVGSMQQPTENEAFATFRAFALSYVDAVLSEARKAKDANKPKTAAQRFADWLEKAEDLTASDVATMLATLNAKAAAMEKAALANAAKLAMAA